MNAKLAGLLVLLVVTMARAEPFILPTLDGSHGIELPAAEPERAKPAIKARALYQAVQDCYPAQSLFRPELALKARASTSKSLTMSDVGAVSTGSRGSVDLVLSIPLWSASELERDREKEYTRRVKASDNVGALIEAEANIAVKERALILARALEKRARERVMQGVADTAEQVAQLKDVVTLEADLIGSRAAIEKAKLALEANCVDGRVVDLIR